MRRRAKRVAIRRISWIDQPMRAVIWAAPSPSFFRRYLVCIGAVPDGGHHGEGEHDQHGVPVPSMPGSGFVMIEAELVLGSLEAALDAPMLAFHPDQRRHGRALGAPGREEGEFAVADATTDEQPTGPKRFVRLRCKTACKSSRIPGVNSAQKFPPRIMRSSGN